MMLFLGLALIVLVVLVAFLFRGARLAMELAVNSVVGFFALYAVRAVMPALPLKLWSVLLTAVLGLPGLIIVVLIHLLSHLLS